MSNKNQRRKRRSNFRQEQMDNIMRYGRTVIAVFADEDSDDVLNDTFSYSIGNSLKGLPELLIIGINDNLAINILSKKMIERGKGFDNNEFVNIGGTVPLCIINADEKVKEEYTIQATSLLGNNNYTVQQVIIPDKAGKFPWDDGCTEPYVSVRLWAKVVH